MTIKQQGGIFGRNPTFNNVTVDGTLTVDQIVEKTGAAGITLDGVTLKDGNVVLADGKGIDFSATAGTGTSELFNDYEEGAWTPAVIGTTTVGVGTYSVQSGVYTKVGNKVLFEAQLTWSAHTGTGNMRVSGLPFTNGTGFSSSCLALPNGITVTAGAQVGANVSATTIVLYNVNAGGLALLALDTAGSLTLSGQYSV